jgi:hypothetical protein
MDPLGDGPFGGDIASDTKVRDVVGRVATTELPLRVIDGSGTPVGSIDRMGVLSVIANEDL